MQTSNTTPITYDFLDKFDKNIGAPVHWRRGRRYGKLIDVDGYKLEAILKIRLFILFYV